MLVDGVGLLAGEAREHLGRPAGRGQENISVVQFFERANESGDGRGLAGAGVTAYQQQVAGLILDRELPERVEQTRLTGSRLIVQVLPQPVGEELRNAHYTRLR